MEKKAIDISWFNIYGLDSQEDGNKQHAAYNYLKSAIVSGRFMPEKPLIEREICDKLEISRTPVREAMRRLTSEGLVESFPGRGAFVAGVSLEHSVMLHELKEAIETMAARLCCDRIEPDELEVLRACIDGQIYSHDSGNTVNYIDSDMAFHVMLVRASHNQLMAEQYKSISWQARRYAQLVAYDPTYTNVFISEHNAIYKAITDHNPDEAEKAVRDHVATIKKFQRGRWSLIFGQHS